jgi:hypothetical protein
MSRRGSLFARALSVLSLLVPAAATATTYVAATDAWLARRAAVVAEVTVAAADPSPASSRPATEYTVQIERLLLGSPAGSTLLVRVPGGGPVAGTSAPGLKVWGAPVLRRGERAVLFLAPNPDGSYRVAGLALGAFHVVERAGRRLAVRDLSELTRLVPGTGGAGAPLGLEQAGAGLAGEAPRDLERFAAWLGDGAGGTGTGARQAAAYEVALSAGERAALAWQVRGAAAPAAAPGVGAPGSGGAPSLSGIAVASAGVPLMWFARNDGQAGWPDLAALAAPVMAAVRQAGETQDDGNALQLEFGGAARSTATLDRYTGESTVLLAGPAADPEVAPAFDCRSGGLASVTGTWFDGDGRVLGGGVIVAAGTACLLAGSPLASAGSLLAHELPLALTGGLPPASRSAAGGGQAPAGAAATPPAAARSMAPAVPGGAILDAGPALFSASTPALAAGSAGSQRGQEEKPRRRRHGGGGGGSTPPPVSNSNLPPRGYQARACGFDLNRNGVFGESADCHQICNGSIGGRDAGGVSRNQVYVSCNTGNDNATCGAPGNPCRTISYAWNSRTAPAGSNTADIICFRGICHEDSIQTAVSGKPGTYLKPQAGSEGRSFELPTHPTMLVGWDYNRNGAYPPYDTADQAVLDGSGLALAIRLSLNTPNSYLELAHFTVRNYGTGSTANNNGFMTLGGAPGSSNHIYVHDLSIENVNAGQALDSGNIIFNFFTGNTQLQHVAFENIQVLNAGGYLARGSGPSGTPGDSLFQNGPLRFERLTLVGRACNAAGAGACSDPQTEAHVVGWKLWGYIAGIEVLDSVVKLNPGAWTPFPSGFGSTAFVAAQCSRDWLIRNNEIDDFKIGLTVQGYAQGYCDGYAARPVDGVVFDRNVFRNTWAPWIYGNNGVVISGGGPNPQTSIGRVVVSNNDFSSTPGWQGMAYIDAGNGGGPDPGNIQFTGNTTFAPLTRSGFGAITVVKNNPYGAQAYSFRNNIIAGTGGGQENLHTELAPAAWNADGNVFDPLSRYTWNNGGCAALPAWQRASGKDANSRACAPRFVNPGGGDFHLLPGDSCAGGAGASLTPPAAGGKAAAHR